MQLLQTLSFYRESLLRLFYPAFCAGCEVLLELQERGLCEICQGRLKQSRFRPSEERIRVSLVYGDEGWALFRYEDLVKEIFHKIKFERRRGLLQIFHSELVDFLRRRPRFSHYDLLIPIPMDPMRRIEREFNQASVLAQNIGRILPKIRLGTRILLKKSSTPPQSFKGRRGRWINLNEVFRVHQAARIQGKKILLVDDIFTTGATLEEGAKTLKAAGAKQVGFFVLARTLAPTQASERSAVICGRN